MEQTRIDKIASVLAVIGAINWGLVGIKSFSGAAYDYDMVNLVLGRIPMLAAIVYILIGLSGIWMLAKLFK